MIPVLATLALLLLAGGAALAGARGLDEARRSLGRVRGASWGGVASRLDDAADPLRDVLSANDHR